MAYPDAEIWLIEADGLKRVKYEETEHYQVMRSFINNPGKMLKILLK
jgi:predicted ATPase